MTRQIWPPPTPHAVSSVQVCLDYDNFDNQGAPVFFAAGGAPVSPEDIAEQAAAMIRIVVGQLRVGQRLEIQITGRDG